MKLARLFAFISLVAVIFAAMLAPAPASAQPNRWHHPMYHHVWSHPAAYHRYWRHHHWYRREWRNHHWIWIRL